MATLVLGTLGTLVGGPLGGAIGSLIGRQVDGAIIGTGTREGPRLKELAVTTSSYGQPIGRQHGRMRVAGTIVWATELAERRERSGGGKGRPSTTSYSYSTSFAVALSSRPIDGIGRIWADGNLLRGAAGDLKVGGTMRLHRGHGDQAPDPLIAADRGPICPALRGCAYVVFEDLQLAEFGNRIPALSFEVFADPHDVRLDDIVAGAAADGPTRLVGLAGLEYAQGNVRSVLATIDQLYPLACGVADGALSVTPLEPIGGAVVPLPDPIAGWEDDDPAALSGRDFRRARGAETLPGAVRYYDPARDYQPGIQRTEGRMADNTEQTIEFPGTLSATTARRLARAATWRAAARTDRIRWRVAAIDPALMPGALVAVPGHPGHWSIAEWEWRERGIELTIERLPRSVSTGTPGDPGLSLPPLDLPSAPTLIHAFELPWDGIGLASERRLFAAVSASTPGWRGAALFADEGGVLTPLAPSGRQRAIIGTTRSALPPSAAVRLEIGAMLDLDLAGADLALDRAMPEDLANGANQLLIGDELLQFCNAERITGQRWQITGLLRGRGGTEAAARRGQPAGMAASLVDERLVRVDDGEARISAISRLAAIGLADDEPVRADVANIGLSLRPLPPVHCRARLRGDGGIDLHWTRRARGAWRWSDGVDVPLVEETELYRVGAGLVERPLMIWETPRAYLSLSPVDLAALPAGTPLWVRQLGRHGSSDPAALPLTA